MEQHEFFIASGPEEYRQYFKLRAIEYERVFGFDGAWLETEDADDRAGAILVCADSTGRIVAGARMNICTPSAPVRLPMEIDGFALQVRLPGMQLQHRNYAEVSRLAVAEEHQNGVLLLQLLDALHEFARSQAVPLVFSICPGPQARLYRIAFRAGRMKQPFHILKEVAVPSKKGIAMRLCLFAEKGEY
jgi:hypothetical protein